MPLPPLPRGLMLLEVFRARKFVDWPNSQKAEPLELTAAERRRLLARAETRARRLHAGEQHIHRDAGALTAELNLIIPTLHPNVIRRWRRNVYWRVYHAGLALDAWRRLQDFLLAHEPKADAWLRRRLGELEGADDEKR